MAQADTTIRPNGSDFAEVKRDLDAAAAKAKEAALKAGEATRETYEDVRGKARDAAHEAQEAGRRAMSQGHEKFFDARVEAEDMVRRNPGLAIAGALGVGVLLGLALKSRR